MKVLIMSGSRNPEGQTARAANAFLDGVREAGAECELIFLPPMKIERCLQCENDGWGICRSEGRCVIDDDLASVADEIRGADAVVFATPVYWSDLSESLQAFLNRLRRICIADSGRAGIEGKPAIGICVAGGGGGGAPECTTRMEWILRTSGFDIVDLIPVRRQNLESKVKTLKNTGKWFALKR
ncbi:MAG: flavodoxin family protein [Armatimonadetes bacterium]|nr:flavodoxin family protein [Armatimonadota bacterium]